MRPVSTNVLVAPRVFADETGVATYQFNIPSQPQLRGVTVNLQAVADDPQANALGAVTSRAARLEICGWEPVARVFANGLDAVMGFRELGVAPVLELTSL